MTDQPENLPEELLTLAEVAKWLKVSLRSARRYVDAGLLEFYVINPGSKRRRIRFTHNSLQQFVANSSKGVKPEERPKRAYHKTAKKWARNKKSGKKGAA